MSLKVITYLQFKYLEETLDQSLKMSILLILIL
jgi:hypothetical protein